MLLNLELTNKLNVEWEEKITRQFHLIHLKQLLNDIENSQLTTKIYETDDTDKATQCYLHTLENIINIHAPKRKRYVKVNRTYWWNADCQKARQERRKAERKYKKCRSRENRKNYYDICSKIQEVYHRNRNAYFTAKLESSEGDARKTYEIVNYLLDNHSVKRKLPDQDDNVKLSNSFSKYFTNKVSEIYKAIKEENQKNDYKPVLYDALQVAPCFSAFAIPSFYDLYHIIRSMNNKSCELDPLPMSIFKQLLPQLLPAVLHIITLSLSKGLFPMDLKFALVKPQLKSNTLDHNVLHNYRPVSNISFLSKILESVVLKQLSEYLESNQLLCRVQSAYRTLHSCETAIVKVHNDIVSKLDKGNNVVLMLFDLSAAFDTINHDCLLKKLQFLYGISGTALSWFASYLKFRKYCVKVKDTLSTTNSINMGVPQGSIIGPVLFIMYTKEIEEIAKKHKMSCHLYADDTQCYFDVDMNLSNHFIQDKVKNFIFEIKTWMSTNYLKLNESKTKLMLLQPPHRCLSNSLLTLEIFLDNCEPIVSSRQVKNLGFILDDTLNLQSHINKVTSLCYINLRNLGRIGSKLPFKLKVQLVHSMVLSHLDMYNSLLYGAPMTLLNKLKQVLYAAVRFIFKLKKRDKQHLSPYLKHLHFLPVQYRIQFKIALLVYKIIHGIAPLYMKDLLSFKKLDNYFTLRSQLDKTLLVESPSLRFTRSHAIFQYCGPKVWNSLPIELRELTSLTQFKSNLKRHYFCLAFTDIPDLSFD